MKSQPKLKDSKIHVALTIAGSDSGGGAGIQADLKTFAALGVHGTSAIVAITAQNTHSVTGIQEISTGIIERQIDAVVQDLGVDSAKTGMLFSSPIISTVAKKVKRYRFPLVVDPVMISKSGVQLLKEDAVETLIKELLPLASVVTPNKSEAERLTGIEIRDLDDAKESAKKIVNEYHAKASVIKGGHLSGGTESVDVLYYAGKFMELSAPRIDTKNTHGIGCTFSSAIAGELAKGRDIPSAVERAKLFINYAIQYAFPIGSGHGPANPTSWLLIPAERQYVVESIKKGIEILESDPNVSRVAPEVQMNLAMALPPFYARGTEDVAGIPGRIVKIGDRVKATSSPAFGGTSHLARAVLKAMEYDGSIRAVCNIRYSEEAVEVARRIGYTVSFYDRRKEPARLKAREGTTLPWVIEQAIKKTGVVPDIIYDHGDIGKEPMLRVWGTDAVDVAKKVVKIAREVKQA